MKNRTSKSVMKNAGNRMSSIMEMGKFKLILLTYFFVLLTSASHVRTFVDETGKAGANDKVQNAGISQSYTGTIRGEVRKENKPAANIVVKLYNDLGDSVTATKTEINGSFEFNQVELGQYELRIDSSREATGYREFIETVVVTVQQVYKKIALEKKGSEVQFSACVMSCKATLSKAGQTNSPSSNSKTGIRSMGSIAGMYSGVTQTSNGVSGRGSRNSGTAVYVDGTRVNNSSLTQSVNPVMENAEAVERPEPVNTEEKLKYQKPVNFKNKPNPRRRKSSAPDSVSQQESYATYIENVFKNPFTDPLSTFSIDVDNASYTNTRRMLMGNVLPPKDAVRIEEFINYFEYHYKTPDGPHPFAVYLETASCPWNKDTRLVQIGIKGMEVDKLQLPPSNLVFLIDVSGSMQDDNKLPLVKRSLKLLVNEMRDQDRIAIVTYAGRAGLALESTSCRDKSGILAGIDGLEAGGSTAGGQGIQLAYKVAKKNFMSDGNNRVILVTDGDFNVGVSSDQEMKSLIESKRSENIFITVCGFGMGNYKDSKLELIADYGNGNYYYIDNINEGRKVFVSGLTGTLMTIAKDVKLQIEFNPALVKAYRLIGYENRVLKTEDFNNDRKDAGDLGAGHTVTAIYEIIPAGSRAEIPGFTETDTSLGERVIRHEFNDEILTVRLRYKQPKDSVSKLLEQVLKGNKVSYEAASENFRFACGVAMYGMLLRESMYKASSSYRLARELVENTKLNVKNGYREELLQLIDIAGRLSGVK